MPVQDFNNFEFSFSLYNKNDVLISGPSPNLPTSITAETGYYIMTDLSNPISASFEKIVRLLLELILSLTHYLVLILIMKL